MKKKRTYFLIIILVLVLVAIPLIYYYPRLTRLMNEPKKIADLFLTASRISSFSVNFLLINIGIFSSAAIIDLVVLGWNKCALKRLFFIRNPTSRGDLWCWVLSLFSLYDFFTLLFSFGLFYVLSSVIVKAGGFSLIQLIPIPFLQFLTIVVLGDLKHYLWHRLMHLMPFWELHKYHHSATEFNLITNSRSHFIEKGILTIFDSILFSLLGAPVEYFILYTILKEFYDQLLHSDINWSLGWFGKYIFISPRAHKIHHANHADFHDKNFGTMLIFWDKLFGTYLSSDAKITIGVENNQYNKNGFWRDMLEGCGSFIKASQNIIKNKFSFLSS